MPLTPLPRDFASLQPNVLIARCSQCKRLAFASELCTTQLAVTQCANMSEPQSDAARATGQAGAQAPLASPAL
jgi:hypothetical protein